MTTTAAMEQVVPDNQREIMEEISHVFTHIEQNQYRGSANGQADMEVAPCYCKFDPDSSDPNEACGENSDCINRALFFECSIDDCPCCQYCQNRRFVNREYAPFEVIKTEKKGYGLRATDLIRRSQFVIEYCGEVLPTSMFAKRAREYAETGVKHFYFMSLKSDEIIDAGRKGNLARFMNHSCVPNCELQKWVVGSQMRMGMFALRDIDPGEELTFDYKFERYGSEPQPCYCGHEKCKGTIGGGKASTGLKGSLDYYDEFDEDDEGPSSRRSPRKGQDDDDYVGATAQVVRRGLESMEEVQKFVRALLSSTKPYRTYLLLQKLQMTESIQIQRRFLHLHGLLVLRSCLSHNFKTNMDICLETLKVLKMLPSVSRNAIIDSKLEDVVRKFVDTPSGEHSTLANELLATWADLPMVYKIPKRADSTAASTEDVAKKRPAEAEAQNDDVKRGRIGADKVFSLADLTVKRTNSGQYNINGSSPFFRPNQSPNSQNLQSPKSNPSIMSGGLTPTPAAVNLLTTQWRTASTDDGKIYYYNLITRETSWEPPKEIAVATAAVGTTQPAEEAKIKPSLVEGISDMDLEAILEEAAAAAQKQQDETADDSGAVKELRGAVSHVVINTLSKYKSVLTTEKFKKMARKITHQIMDKEIKRQGQNVSSVITEEMESKMKKFTKQALEDAGIKTESVNEHSSSKSKSSNHESSHKSKADRKESSGHSDKHDKHAKEHKSHKESKNRHKSHKDHHKKSSSDRKHSHEG